MKFPSIEVNNISDSCNLLMIFDKVFGEENSVEFIEKLDNGTVRMHFNQELPMTQSIEEFYKRMKTDGETKIKDLL